VALLLRNRGVERVRPLAGGLDAWRDAGYRLQAIAGAEPAEPVAPARGSS